MNTITKRPKSILFIAAIFAFMLTLFILNNNALAVETLSNEFPDPDIVSKGQPMAVAAYTTYTKSETSTYRVWSKQDITFTVTIKNGNYCPANNPHDSRQPGDNGAINNSTLTKYIFRGLGPGSSKTADYNNNCGQDITFSQKGTPVNAQTDPGNGYKYYVDLDVTQPDSGPKTGILNYYKLIASGGGDVKIAIRGDSKPGLGTTIQQVDSSQALTNFRIKFGQCSGQDKLGFMQFYDLDNDIYGSGAQRLRYITWEIQRNGNTFDNGSFPKTENQDWNYAVSPIVSDKQYKFLAKDVYTNNVFQFSVPVDQIGYENCDKPDPCPPPNQNLYPPNCPNPPDPRGFNWAVTSASSVTANSPIASGVNYVVVNQNSSFTFSHDRNKAWNDSDKQATTWIDIDVISNKSSIDFPDQWKTLDLYGGQDIDINPKDWTYSSDKAGVYCQQIKYPTTYTGGMTGRAKVINKTIAANGTHTTDTGLESNNHFLDKNGTPNKPDDDYYYDKVRRYAHYPTGGGWLRESTVKNPVGGAPPEKIWWWDNGVEQSSTTNIPNYYWASGPYGAEYSTNQVCAYVAETDPVAPADSEYEKGDSSIVNFGASANSGDADLPQNVTFTASYNIGAPLNKTGTVSVVIGPGIRNKTQSSPVNLTDAEKAILNNLAPGTKVPFSISMNGNNQYGEITITEVPFARFYGNDIYSTDTNGQIKFNDSDNANTPGSYQERGSVAQYAAFAAGTATNYLDTAGFRYFAGALNPTPPVGLLSENSTLNGISSSSVYDKILQSKPTDCLDNYNNINGKLADNSVERLCYVLDGASPIVATPQPGSFDYRKKVTVIYNDDLYITKNIINTSASRTDPELTAVALFAAKNIYIDKSVTRIDAILIAQEDIDTCFNTATNSPIANTNLEDAGQCRNKLVINGSVSGKNIKFKRVGGSRYLAPAGALPGNAVGAGVVEKDGEQNLPLNSGLSAEIINFPAYLYWAQPYLVNESTSGGKVNAIYTAPPRQ